MDLTLDDQLDAGLPRIERRLRLLVGMRAVLRVLPLLGAHRIGRHARCVLLEALELIEVVAVGAGDVQDDERCAFLAWRLYGLAEEVEGRARWIFESAARLAHCATELPVEDASSFVLKEALLAAVRTMRADSVRSTFVTEVKRDCSRAMGLDASEGSESTGVPGVLAFGPLWGLAENPFASSESRREALIRWADPYWEIRS